MISERIEKAGEILVQRRQERALASLDPGELARMDPLDAAVALAARAAEEAEIIATLNPGIATFRAAERARRDATAATFAASQPQIPEIEGETPEQLLAGPFDIFEPSRIRSSSH
ncbi:hypothetical protein FQN54_005082 [Arachnomyces sp. PD_36]|nr:hypothetical protein FQN54_005082 [Arachnomyces sp. PD_36]